MMSSVSDYSEIKFDADGLVPCAVQDSETGELLMLAYMNSEALKLTLETDQVHFYSRSRGEIWHKGKTSGNFLNLRSLRYDCDGDALLAVVAPVEAACHTGQRSCFYRGFNSQLQPHEALPELERVIEQRKQDGSDGSYTVKLLNDSEFAGSKVQEEAEEVVRAVLSESDERVAEEAADLIYHLTVLVHQRGLSLSDAYEVLLARRGS